MFRSTIPFFSVFIKTNYKKTYMQEILRENLLFMRKTLQLHVFSHVILIIAEISLTQNLYL